METTEQTKEKPRRLTKKQKGFVKDYVDTGNASEAVRRNYDVVDVDTAKSMGTENLAKPYIAEAVEEQQKKLAERIPDGLLVERHIELLNKREVHRVSVDGEAEYELIDQPDTQAVSKGLEMAYKLKGAFAVEVLPTVSKTVHTYNFIFSPETQSDIREIEERLKARLIQPHATQNDANTTMQA